MKAWLFPCLVLDTVLESCKSDGHTRDKGSTTNTNLGEWWRECGCTAQPRSQRTDLKEGKVYDIKEKFVV